MRTIGATQEMLDKKLAELKRQYPEARGGTAKNRTINYKKDCPECGASMRQQEGCALCPSCGYSPCK